MVPVLRKKARRSRSTLSSQGIRHENPVNVNVNVNVNVTVAARCFSAALAQARDNHRRPGAAHASSMPLEARSVVQTSGALAAKPERPVAITANRGRQPRGGDPRVTLNPQPIPQGRSKVKAL
ncbi:MAG: hypothetical protein M3Y55_14910 [Pseudomonadota bacterium]|nr:hypothetical protein [Pseudomonadota bacterium]